MSREAIKDKLKAILQDFPRSEADVVYVMVEIRKLLEQQGKAKEEEFSTLKFFCDWVAHVELSFAGAKRVLARLDPEIGPSGSFDPSSVRPDSELYRLMSLEPLNEEVKRFCQENDLPARWAWNPTMWRECMRLYGHVIADCPLVIIRETASARHIQRLTLINVRDSQPHPDKSVFHWGWEFELSDGTTFVLSHEFSYPSPNYDPSRPTTAEFGF
jgi:hypothetical protein